MNDFYLNFVPPSQYINCMGSLPCVTKLVNGVSREVCDASGISDSKKFICKELGYIYPTANEVYDSNPSNECQCTCPALSFNDPNALNSQPIVSSPTTTVSTQNAEFCCKQGYFFKDGSITDPAAVYNKLADNGNFEHLRCFSVACSDESVLDQSQKVPFYEDSADENSANSRRVWRDSTGLETRHDTNFIHGTCEPGFCLAPMVSNNNIDFSGFPSLVTTLTSSQQSSVYMNSERFTFDCDSDTHCGSVTYECNVPIGTEIGAWKLAPNSGSCSVKRCVVPAPPENGKYADPTVNSGNFLADTVRVVFECSTGFQLYNSNTNTLAGSDNFVTCDANTCPNQLVQPFNCQENPKCPKAEDVPHGKVWNAGTEGVMNLVDNYDHSLVEVGSFVNYVCDSGYELTRTSDDTKATDSKDCLRQGAVAT